MGSRGDLTIVLPFHRGKVVEGILIPTGGSIVQVAATEDNFVSILDLKTLTETGRIEIGAGPDGLAWI